MVSGADKRVEFVAYSAQTVSGRLREVYTEAELLACVQEAQAAGWTVTFRGGGMAFDTHALNDGMVIQLRGFDEIGDVVDGTITVGANARWDAILEKTCASGHLPYVLVSTEYATVGGTISADSLSRFSPSCGKEGNHVERLRFMKVDGTVLECSREENSEVFRGAVNGFGLLGAVLSVTYRLMPAPFAKVVVKTDFDRFRGLRSLATKLVTAVDEHHAELRRPEGVPASRKALGDVPVGDARAISAVVYMNAQRDGFVMRSSYIEGKDLALEPCPFHRPKSFLHRALQVLALFDVTRRIGYWYILNVYLPLGKVKHATDDLFGYSFFQGGNDAVRRAGRSHGFAMGIIQQTFVVPRTAGDSAGTAERLAAFLECAETVFERHRVSPPLIDVLYLPNDMQEGFPLSSSYGVSGYAITVTFEHPFTPRFPKEEAAFAELAEEVAKIGGRVHLVKNVFAAPATLEKMYAQGVETMRGLKRDLDPRWTLRSDFVKRLFPSLAEKDGAAVRHPGAAGG